jgi:Flp pilus assembly pilin Flp
MKTLSFLSTRLKGALAAKRQKGATMIEYVLLAALIGVVSAVMLDTLGAQILVKFTEIKDALL